MNYEQIKESIGDYAKDIRLNLANVLSQEGAPGLTIKQIWIVALSCAYVAKEPNLVSGIKDYASKILSAPEIESAKSVATIMAMNNVYYRFTHLCEDKEIAKLPARLRMNVIGNPGIAKEDFELACLAVSSINGCGACMNAHVNVLRKSGMMAEGIQAAVRIAAVINAAAQALSVSHNNS